MRLWRLVKTRYAITGFVGEGARRFGGRWNSKGSAVVYCSTTLSLAALEILVNLAAEDFGTHFVFLQAEVPNEVPMATCAFTELPDNWREYPAPVALAAIGDTWIEQANTLLLAVPSAVIPQEQNILINPSHPDFRAIRFYPPKLFVLDPRLLKKTQ